MVEKLNNETMKKAYFILTLMLALTFYTCNTKNNNSNRANSSNDNELTATKNSYLGQKPPGLIPEPFAPGMVSTKHYEFSGVFSPDMKEFYFISSGGKYEKATLVLFQYIKGRWVESAVSPWVGQPTFSPDGNTMYFGDRYKERTKTGWSELKDLEEPLKGSSEKFMMRLTVSNNGTYYFDTYDKENPNSPIRYSRFIGDKYEQPKALSDAINAGTQLNHPFIAPDESYLMWDAKREDGYGDSDIYISFKQNDGSWGDAINMGDKINTDAWEASPSVTPDGKYLFFNRNMGSDKYEDVDIFWVDTQIIKNLKEKQN